MKLLIRQRVFSWTDSYDVYDETGRPKYFVKAEWFTLGHQIHVYEKATGREVGSIHQKLFRFLPAFEIVLNGQAMGTVRKEFTFFSPRYSIDYQGWTAEGDLFGWDYDVRRGNVTVLHISKELFTWGDTYAMTFENPAVEMPGLLLVIAIDAANCSQGD